MMFCPKCGAILRPKKDKNKKVLHCTCGYTLRDLKNTTIKETLHEEKKIEVVPEQENTLPITDAECAKCKNKKAFYWLIQTRAGDEPETRFFRCTACKYTWREYS
jgi:DNA-directed RNA polymerase subunit M